MTSTIGSTIPGSQAYLVGINHQAYDRHLVEVVVGIHCRLELLGQSFPYPLNSPGMLFTLIPLCWCLCTRDHACSDMPALGVCPLHALGAERWVLGHATRVSRAH